VNTIISHCQLTICDTGYSVIKHSITKFVRDIPLEERLKTQVTELQVKISGLVSQVDAQRSEAGTTNKQIEELQKQNASLKTDIETLEAAASNGDDDLNDERRTAAQHLKEYKAAEETAKRQVSDLQKQVENLRQQVQSGSGVDETQTAEVSQLKSEAAATNKQIEELQKQNASLKTEVETLEADAPTGDDSAAQHLKEYKAAEETAKAAEETAKRQVGDLQKQVESLRQQVQSGSGDEDADQLQQLRGDMEAANEVIGELRTDLEESQADLEVQLEEAQLHQDEVEELNEELSEANRLKTSTEQEQLEMQKQVSSLKSDNDEMKERLEEYDNQISELETENELLKSSGGAQASEEDRAKIEAETQREINSMKVDLESTIARLQEENAGLQASEDKKLRKKESKEEKIQRKLDAMIADGGDTAGGDTAGAGDGAEPSDQVNGGDASSDGKKKKRKKKKKQDEDDSTPNTSKRGKLEYINEEGKGKKRYARMTATAVTLWNSKKDGEDPAATPRLLIPLDGANVDHEEDYIQIEDKHGKEYQLIVPDGAEDAAEWAAALNKNVRLLG
jgi:epidermal growth factor receptor substrate 15